MGDSIFCPGQSVSLIGTGADDYTWTNTSTGIETSGSGIKVSSPGGTYQVIGHANTGCDSEPVNYTVRELPDFDLFLDGDRILCEGDSAIITVESDEAFLWDNGSNSSSRLVIAPQTCVVIAKDAYGCVKKDTAHIQAVPLPGAEIFVSRDKINYKESEVIFTTVAEESTNYNWILGDGSVANGDEVLHDYNTENEPEYFIVNLEAVTDFGCLKSSKDIINVVPYVPNVFSPNGDGVNDLFMPGVETQVFDRFGKVLYEGMDGWDGIYNGEAVSQDTYFYSLTYPLYDIKGNKQEFNEKGYVTLVR